MTDLMPYVDGEENCPIHNTNTNEEPRFFRDIFPEALKNAGIDPEPPEFTVDAMQVAEEARLLNATTEGSYSSVCSTWIKWIKLHQKAVEHGTTPENPYKKEESLLDKTLLIQSPDEIKDILRNLKPYFDGTAFQEITGQTKVDHRDATWYHEWMRRNRAEGNDLYSGGTHDQPELTAHIGGEEFTFNTDPFWNTRQVPPWYYRGCEECRSEAALDAWDGSNRIHELLEGSRYRISLLLGTDDTADVEVKPAEELKTTDELKRAYRDIMHTWTASGEFFKAYITWLDLLEISYRARESSAPYVVQIHGNDEQYELTSEFSAEEILDELEPYFHGDAYQQITGRDQTTPHETRWFRDEVKAISMETDHFWQANYGRLYLEHDLGEDIYSFSFNLFHNAPECDPDCSECTALEASMPEKTRHYIWDEDEEEDGAIYDITDCRLKCMLEDEDEEY